MCVRRLGLQRMATEPAAMSCTRLIRSRNRVGIGTGESGLAGGHRQAQWTFRVVCRRAQSHDWSETLGWDSWIHIKSVSDTAERNVSFSRFVALGGKGVPWLWGQACPRPPPERPKPQGRPSLIHALRYPMRGSRSNLDCLDSVLAGFIDRRCLGRGFLGTVIHNDGGEGGSIIVVVPILV